MRVSGTPSSMICRMAASVREACQALLERSCSLMVLPASVWPRPSAPWQSVQRLVQTSFAARASRTGGGARSARAAVGTNANARARAKANAKAKAEAMAEAVAEAMAEANAGLRMRG